ncbi:MAG TPA: hypothetical protein VMM12_15390 [Longimicrobiales bacterium]|nr:hypothetical protein [Longimicrobiales bacterium]
MAIRHLIQRLSPQLDRRWLIALGVAALLVVAATFVRWGGTPAPLELVALGPQATFDDTVTIPAAWTDTTTAEADVVARVPLVLAVRNPGLRALRPDRLELSLPVRFRIDAPGEDLEPRMDPSSPLVTYTLYPELGPIEPRRLPVMLPAYDTLWLEVIIPSYYCVSVADSVPEFVAAPPPPLGSMADVRIFYSFDGGDLDRRLTGVLGVRLDTTMLRPHLPSQPPSYPMEADPGAANPELGMLTYGGARRSRCGEPADPMELLSTVWETVDGGRFIALDYGGKVRKHLFDLNGDSIIERESWDPDGNGIFSATRRTSLPIPAFLLPERPVRYDMARLDTLPPDSLVRLDPYRRAMPGPGRLPSAADTAIAPAPAAVAADPDPDPDLLPDSLPRPVIRAPQPLGRPLRPDTTRPRGGGPSATPAGPGGPGGAGGPGGSPAP